MSQGTRGESEAHGVIASFRFSSKEVSRFEISSATDLSVELLDINLSDCELFL